MFEFFLYSFFSVLMLILGASIGSFIGLVCFRQGPDRGKEWKSIVNSRSKCDNCSTTLSWKELFPLLSYIIQQGKCRNCKVAIPRSYFYLELLCGINLIIFLMIFLHNSNLPLFILNLVVSYTFIYLGYYDFLYWEVPLKFLITYFISIIAILIIAIIIGEITTWIAMMHLIAGFTGMILIILLIILSRGKGLGLGDAWIMGIMGLILGWQDLILAFFIAVFAGSLIGLIKVISTNGKIKGTMLQFVPFLAFGVIAALIDNGLIFDILFPHV